MKKLLAVIFVVFVIIFSVRAEDDVLFAVELPSEVDLIEFSPLQYIPETVVTNAVYEWVETKTVTPLGLFDGGGFETNMVGHQVVSFTFSTNAAHWTTTFPKNIPSSRSLKVNEVLDAKFRRDAVADVTLTLSPDQLQIILDPELYELTLVAAKRNGPQPVGGDLADALRGVIRSAIGVSE